MTITSHFFRITFAINCRFSSMVWSIGKNASNRNDAEYTSAIASASAAVARRSVKGAARTGSATEMRCRQIYFQPTEPCSSRGRDVERPVIATALEIPHIEQVPEHR